MTDHDLKAYELSRAWDTRGNTLSETQADDEMTLIVDRLESEFRMPTLNQASMDAIWSNVVAGAVGGIVASNPIATPARSSVFADRSSRYRSAVTRFAWIVMAGLLGGFVAGIGARFTMRLAGYLTIESNRFFLTENDARVGELTLNGTLILGSIGAAMGVMSLMFYVLIKDRLPFDGWKRSASFSVILLLVFGFVLMDPTNPDYHTFGPAWLNVVTFSSLYLLMGMCVVQVYESGRAWSSRNVARFDHGIMGRLKVPVASVLSLVGIYFMIPALFLGTAAFLIPLLAGLIWLGSKAAKHISIPSFEMPVLFRQWGIWVVPGLVGFILTARGITDILMN